MKWWEYAIEDRVQPETREKRELDEYNAFS